MLQHAAEHVLKRLMEAGTPGQRRRARADECRRGPAHLSPAAAWHSGQRRGWQPARRFAGHRAGAFAPAQMADHPGDLVSRFHVANSPLAPHLPSFLARNERAERNQGKRSTIKTIAPPRKSASACGVNFSTTAMGLRSLAGPGGDGIVLRPA